MSRIHVGPIAAGVQIGSLQDHQITSPVLESAGEGEFARKPVLWATSYIVITCKIGGSIVQSKEQLSSTQLLT